MKLTYSIFHLPYKHKLLKHGLWTDNLAVHFFLKAIFEYRLYQHETKYIRKTDKVVFNANMVAKK